MPEILKAEHFLSMRPQYKNQQAEGEVPAAVEHLFSQGKMIDHYFVTLSPELVADVAALPDFARQGGKITGVDFCQQPDGEPWRVHFSENPTTTDLYIDMPDSEFRAMLTANRIVLPGEG